MINSRWSEEEREQVPLVDETGRVTGCVLRSQVHNGSFLLHPVVHLHVLGPGNTLLLQKRPLHKDIQPGKWDTAVGGHISFGETPSEALVREAEEETGLVTFIPQLVRTYIWTSEVEREYVHLFVTREYHSPELRLLSSSPGTVYRDHHSQELKLLSSSPGTVHSDQHNPELRLLPSSPGTVTFAGAPGEERQCVDGPSGAGHPAEVEELRFWRAEEITAHLGKNIFTPNFEHDFQQLLDEGFLK